MKKYQITIKIKGQLVKTVVFAESEIHARLLVEFKYGMGCIVGSIQKVAKNEWALESSAATLKPIHLVKPVKPNKPLSPEKARIKTLKQVKDTATQNLQRERDRQKNNNQKFH
jgi:hypothetical protein